MISLSKEKRILIFAMIAGASGVVIGGIIIVMTLTGFLKP